MSDTQLKSLAERIERLMDERDGIQSDIRDIYTEAKSAGFVPKVLRKAITRKRMDPDKRDEEDTILDLYEGALSPSMRKAVEMAARNASAREIEAATGIDQATVARSVSLNKKSETATTKASGNSAHEGEENGVASPSAPQRDEREEAAAQPAKDTTESCGPVRPVGEPTVAGGPPSHRMDAPVLDAGTSASLGETVGVVAPGPQDLSSCGGDIIATHEAGAVAEAEPQRVASHEPSPVAWAEITAAREEHEARKKAERDAARERRRAAERRIAEFNARVDADPLIPPAFLDRRQKATA